LIAVHAPTDETPPTELPAAQAPPPDRSGVPRVFLVIAALLAVAAVPYLVPRLAPYRIHRPGEPWAIARALEFRMPVRPERIAGMASATVVPASDEELLALAFDEQPEGGAPPPAAAAASPSGPNAALRIPAAALRGPGGRLDDPEGAMRHFYARLRAVARREPGAIARISVYSESINGADWVTSRLRHRLAERFGDGGKGFVPIAPGWASQRHRDVRWDGVRGFRTYVVNRGDAPGDRYGLGGVLAVARSAHARVRYATVDDGTVGRAVSRFRLLHQAFPGGGEVSIQVDDAAPRVVSTESASVEDRAEEVVVPSGPHRFEVRARGEPVRLYGAVLEDDGPGVVVDGLMLIGAFARVLLHFDAAHWQAQVRERAPDLLVFWLGGNDASSRSVGFDPDRFVTSYSAAIERAHAGRPEASCLVVSVLDVARRRGGALRSVRRVPSVVDAQAEVARRAGCAFYDAFEAMGGAGTMARWYRSSPRLASSDLKHLTRAGAHVVAMMIERALLRGYDAYLAEGGTE
jgi:lysophospholipase L1-like esterase